MESGQYLICTPLLRVSRATRGPYPFPNLTQTLPNPLIHCKCIIDGDRWDKAGRHQGDRSQKFCCPRKGPIIPVKTRVWEEQTVGNENGDEEEKGNAPIIKEIGFHATIIKDKPSTRRPSIGSSTCDELKILAEKILSRATEVIK